MHRRELHSFLVACMFAFLVRCAPAQTTPTMKAGLWEIHLEREENGQKMPDPSDQMNERMKNMSPEKRAQVEEMMKQRGYTLGAGGVSKICYSKNMVEHGAFANQNSCKTDYSKRTATSWKWHSSCPAFGYEGDGEATFADANNFMVKSSGVSTIAGKTKTSTTTRTGKWLGADCGDLKPMDSTP